MKPKALLPAFRYIPLLRGKACLFLVFLSGALHLGAAEFDHRHILLDQVLKTHVHNALVDYKSLKSKPRDLDNYLSQTAAVRESDFKKWNQNQQMAFLINLYNATTLRLILDHYPIASIKKIGNIFKGPWDQDVVGLFGDTIDLATVEHKMLRKNYTEPRIHFAIVCAALGCPPLRSEAYLPERLDQQLNDQGNIFLSDSSKNAANLPNRALTLSPIFKWFDDDFEAKSGSVLKFVTPYFPAPVRPALQQGRLKIGYSDYDWSLNDSGK